MKKTKYSGMSRGGIGGMPESSTALLTGSGRTLTRFVGACSSPRKGPGLVLSLKSRGTEEGPTGPHRSEVQSCVGVGSSLGAPTRS